jgi:hypothetical protein
MRRLQHLRHIPFMVCVIVISIFVYSRVQAGCVWLIMGEPQPVHQTGGTFETELKFSSWDTVLGAYLVTVHYDPAVLEILEVTTPPESEFYGKTFIDEASFRNGRTDITAYQVENRSEQNTPATFARIKWKVVGTAGTPSDIEIELKTAIDAAFRSVEGLTYADTTIYIEEDSDEDGMLDSWEMAYFGSLDQDGSDDFDDDGLSDLEEFQSNTDPTDWDSDDDDLPDGWEVSNGLDPLDDSGENGRDGDFDNDGWSNYEEYFNVTDPNDNTSPIPTPPGIIEINPHDGAGIDPDTTRVPNNASFAVLIEDEDGIDITDLTSIRFTVNDSLNPEYDWDLGAIYVVRVIKITSDPDTEVTKLWAVYDRAVDIYGNYGYDTDVNIKIDAKDRRGDWMTQGSFDFNIETQPEHDDAQANQPDVVLAGTTGTGYDAGIEIANGELQGAKILYNSNEPVSPIFGPTDELPAFDVNDIDAVGLPMNLQPPTVFNSPVKIFVPCPGYADVSGLSIYLYDGTDWLLACEANGNVQPGGENWMVRGSRVNNNNGFPSTIEIQIYHFSGVQAGLPAAAGGGGSDDGGGGGSDDGGGDGGCFITALVYGSMIEPNIKPLKEFRDLILRNNVSERDALR